MNMPFTVEEFLNVFRQYNDAIWPAQVAAYWLGLAVAFVVSAGPSKYANYALGGLALFWAWNGVAYHGLFFSQINPAAMGFAVLFAVQGGLLGYAALKPKVGSQVSPVAQVIGWGAVGYAMLGYPLLNQAFGHAYPAMPVFGIAPCPTTIFSFGVLLLLGERAKGYLFVIPVVWAIVATSAALQLGMSEDLGLSVTAFLALVVRLGMAVHHRPHHRLGLAG